MATQGPQQLLMTLADGDWHSGELLAQRLDITRMTVSNYAKQLVAAGFPIESKSRAGYRLNGYAEVLDQQQLAHQTGLPVTVAATADSTNDLALAYLKSLAANGANQSAAVFIAEHQSAGRGRRGRVWQSKPGEALLYSLAWSFDRFPPDLPALSLMVATVLIESLQSFGVADGLGIKWPNDVLLNQQKLAGVLVEAVVRDEQVSVVIGIGLNMLASPKVDTRYPATSLREQGMELGRGDLAATLTNKLKEALPLFADNGFAAFHPAYMQHDIVVGQSLSLDDEALLIKTIDETGALVAQSAGKLKRYVSGELSLPWPAC